MRLIFSPPRGSPFAGDPGLPRLRRQPEHRASRGSAHSPERRDAHGLPRLGVEWEGGPTRTLRVSGLPYSIHYRLHADAVRSSPSTTTVRSPHASAERLLRCFHSSAAGSARALSEGLERQSSSPQTPLTTRSARRGFACGVHKNPTAARWRGRQPCGWALPPRASALGCGFLPSIRS